MVVLSSVIRMYSELDVSIGVEATAAHEYSGRSSGMSNSAGSNMSWIQDNARGCQLRKCSSVSISSSNEKLCLI